jgi:ABC-2 type transport system permease protein
MLGASLYIIVCSVRNRTRVRLRRLREPRYLIGAIVGVAYLYFSFFGRLRGARSTAERNAAGARRNRTAPALSAVPGLVASGTGFTGIALLLVAAVSWLAPLESGLLDFSEAETQFLFPAPVSRRQLLMHRMLRSQIGLLFATVVFSVAVPSVSGSDRLWLGLATWFLMVTAKVYYTGVTLTRARIRAASAAERRLAWVAPAVVLAAAAIVAIALTRAFLVTPPSGFRDVLRLIGDVSLQPLPRIVLWPFVALVRPVFATSPGGYVRAVAGSAAVLAATVLWVLKSDEAFHDAADDAARRRGRQAQGQRTVSYRTRSAGWTLALTGRPEAAFAWKAAMQTLRVVDKRGMARIAAILFVLTAAAMSAGREGPAATLGAFASAAAIFAILMAPQILRIDIRQDLQHLELLKTWPVRASAVVRGELLWPGILISGIAWTMIAVATALSGTVLPRTGVGWRVGIGIAIAIVAPALVFAQLTVHNAVALMFPAWVPLGNQRARGLDAMGQRIIMLGGTWLLLIVMALPGAIAAGIVWFALGRFLGPAGLIPAAVVCSAIIAVEVLLATEAVGPVYERLDVLAVERAE